MISNILVYDKMKLFLRVKLFEYKDEVSCVRMSLISSVLDDSVAQLLWGSTGGLPIKTHEEKL